MMVPSVIALKRSAAARSWSADRSVTITRPPSGVQSRPELTETRTPSRRGTSASARAAASQTYRWAAGSSASRSTVRIARRLPSRAHTARRTSTRSANGFSVAPVAVSMTSSVSRDGDT